MDTRSAEGATTFTTTEEANCYQGGECDRGYPPCPGPKLCRKRGESAATPNAGAQPTEPKDPPPPVPGLHVPPFVYDPKQGKMVSTTPGFKELCAYLRALYDKTADAHGGLDYPDRVNVALIAVYDYGRRKAASSTALKPSDDVVEILTHLCEQAEQMTHMLYPSDAAAMGVPCTERARAYLASLPSSSGERADAMWEAAAYCRDCAEASERCGAENRAAAQHEMANELQRRAAATPSHERQP